MASSMIYRVVVTAAAPTAASSSSSSTAASTAAGHTRHGGFVSMSCHALEGRASKRSHSVSLSSAHCTFRGRVLFPCACMSSDRQQQYPPQHGAVCMVLPTGNPVKEGQGTGSQGHPAWSARAIKSFSMSELEARKLKYPTTGTESLLMGILTEGTSHASRFLRANGVTLFAVRDETIKILGKADMYFFSPEHPPLTEQAQKALDWAIDERTRKGGDDEVTASYMLLGIWAQKGSAGQKVLEALDFNDKKAEELIASERKPVAVS